MAYEYSVWVWAFIRAWAFNKIFTVIDYVFETLMVNFGIKLNITSRKETKILLFYLFTVAGITVQQNMIKENNFSVKSEAIHDVPSSLRENTVIWYH